MVSFTEVNFHFVGHKSLHAKEFDFAYSFLDLHPHNVVSQLPNIDSWTVEQIYEKFGQPQKEKMSRYDGQPLGPEAPPYTVLPAIFWSIGEENLTNQIKIIDFGEASLSERKESHIPLLFRPPESMFDESVGQPADIWAFACTVFKIFSNEHLCDGFMASTDTILIEMVCSLGLPPPQWWERWPGKIYYFTSESVQKALTTSCGVELSKTYTGDYGSQERKSLAQRIQEMRTKNGEKPDGALRPFKPEELANLQALLASALKYLPSERPTAEEISKSEWILEHSSGLGTKDLEISPADLPSLERWMESRINSR